jgi:hypothetical protein
LNARQAILLSSSIEFSIIFGTDLSSCTFYPCPASSPKPLGEKNEHHVPMKNEDVILLKLLNQTFNKSTKSNIRDNYLKNLKNVSKWKCFSDYCFDDKNKPNNVVTFSIFPNIDNYLLLEKYISEIAITDIKKTKTVQNNFIEFLKEYPLINFSFILNNRETLFGDTSSERKESVLNHLNWAVALYKNWIKNEPDKNEYYLKIIKVLEECIIETKNNRKIKIYIDLILVSFLGAYVYHIILSEINEIEVIGWFSDRDKIFEIGDGLIINFFQNNLHGLLTEKNSSYQFVSSLSNSNFDIFYDHFIKIPDYIAGTLADFNIDKNLISKNKFDKILTEYMGAETNNNFVFRIFKENDQFKCGKIQIRKK